MHSQFGYLIQIKVNYIFVGIPCKVVDQKYDNDIFFTLMLC